MHNISNQKEKTMSKWLSVAAAAVLVGSLTGCNSSNNNNNEDQNLGTTIVNKTVLAAGDTNCPNGGVELIIVFDTDEDGTVDQVTQTEYVCNGADGAAGHNGQDGQDGTDVKGNIGFNNFVPLTLSANAADWNANSPWKLPVGFSAKTVNTEADLNIYPNGLDDWHDMNVVNETGKDAGRYMYRTHEVRLGDSADPAINAAGGAVSVVDLQTGESKIIAQSTEYTALDGIDWTPWGSVVFAEETTGGSFFEIILNDDMMSGTAVERPAVGYLAHEGMQFDTDGNLYVVDEHRGRTSGCTDSVTGEEVLPCGGIYKFVPDTKGDLSAGQLYVLGFPDANRDGTGQGAWLGPIDPENAREAGTKAGGASYQRPEDLEIIDGVLYAAITEGPRDEYGKEYYEGRVLAIDLNTTKVTNFVKAGVNAPVELGKPGQDRWTSNRI